MSSPRASRQPKKVRKRVITLAAAGDDLPPGEPVATPGNATVAKDRDIQALIDLARRNNLAELEVERAGVRIRIRWETGAGATPTSLREVPATVVEQHKGAPLLPHVSEAAGYVTVTSPIVGTFYRSPSPDADAYVDEGDIVRKGQVLCIVEAMKLMNEIESEVDGRIVKVMVESTNPVEYGQPLFLIDPKATL